jgi:hypothetical protein
VVKIRHYAKPQTVMSNFKAIAVQETMTGLNTQSNKKGEENDQNTL